MKESGKKREWVKSAAIVFLSVMLVLTFFSNTIMNYSLPEVATQYVQSGSITAKIRGTGMVESGDPYNVEVKESRKVASVAVRVGDTVAKGDVLVYLEDEESDELKAATEALEAARKAYDKALLDAKVTSSDIYAAEHGVSTDTYRNQITALQNAIKAEQDRIVPLQTELDELNQWSSDISKQLILEASYDTSARERLDSAKGATDLALNKKNAQEAELQAVKTETAAKVTEITNKITAEETKKQDAVTAGDQEAADAAQAEIDKLNRELTEVQNKETEAQKAYDDAESAYEEAVKKQAEAQKNFDERSVSNAVTNLNDQKAVADVNIYHLNNEITKINDEIAKKQEEMNKLVQTMNNVMGLSDFLTAVAAAEEKVAELTEKAVDATITAPISGTITTINVTAGESTTAAQPVVVMQPEGQGYTLSFSVTNEQARRLSVGDKADLVNAWRYDDVEVVLANIKPDKNNPGQQKQLTFRVSGEVVAGQTLNLSVGQKSANYDYIVPKSAVREDNNGQFILIIESKQSPLGTRYSASRVDVKVIASDDTQSAISGAIQGYEFVITTSTAPVQAGDLVRLAE